MAKKAGRNTKARIVAAAWRLFYEQGYEDTTVEDIVFESETSKGSFYHYFEGKDALLGSLSVLFDEKYEELRPRIDPEADAVETLVFLNRELFNMIDNSVSLELLARLFSSQLVTRGEKHLLDRSRTYFKVLRQIISEGQRRGTSMPTAALPGMGASMRTDMAANEIAKAYAMFERGMMYDWCLCGGEYALGRYSALMMPMFLQGFRPER